MHITKLHKGASMKKTEYTTDKITVLPINVWLHGPPTVWKGDRLGHIGVNDTFFYMVKGECFVSIDNRSFMIKEGQLAFLPKGKMRVYTHVSEEFIMYEMAFSAKIGDEDLMEYLELCDGDFAVDVRDKEKMCGYFEESCRKEMRRDPVFDLGWSANIIRIIAEFSDAHREKSGEDGKIFYPVTEYMAKNMDRQIKTGELAELVYMQTTYFIRRFGKVYGLSPQSYLTRLRINRAMELLSSTDMSIEKVAKSVGIPDTSYFSRVFKNQCGTSPGTYRSAFRK